MKYTAECMNHVIAILTKLKDLTTIYLLHEECVRIPPFHTAFATVHIHILHGGHLDICTYCKNVTTLKSGYTYVYTLQTNCKDIPTPVTLR
jgi:hypothetical protein